MARLNDRTRTAIRRRYFVERRSLDTIAAELRLDPATVRRALILRGGLGPDTDHSRKELDA